MNIEYMKQRRLELGLSLQTVAEKMGFKNASTYSKYENGEYNLKANMLPGLSKILECNINDFYND